MIQESTVEVLGPFPAFPQEVVREEVSQARVGIPEARSAGPIHRAFIDALPPEWQGDPAIQIFSRALWLKRGWYPLTPHFHFDWGRAADAPPVETIMVCVGDASLTEFILGPLDHPERPSAPGGRSGPGGMNAWDGQVAAGLRSGSLRSWTIASEQLFRFDNRALHRARPAVKVGWRILVRAIRGLTADGDRNQDGYGSPGAFTTCRNTFIAETDAERSRYQPYHE